ncbi:hypothetical protein KI387_041699, partial [Taxus chinensis]
IGAGTDEKLLEMLEAAPLSIDRDTRLLMVLRYSNPKPRLKRRLLRRKESVLQDKNGRTGKPESPCPCPCPCPCPLIVGQARPGSVRLSTACGSRKSICSGICSSICSSICYAVDVLADCEKTLQQSG